jgi:valyl-tRNA synthetase
MWDNTFRMTFPQNYDHKTRESHWQQEWEERGIYQWRNDRPRDETYVIDTPPPTVSGLLHMGHVFSYTHADFIARYQRMKGKDVFYPMGFDDNGLPTERLVEKTKKVRATDMSREAFIALCEEVSAEARVEFRSLFSATALSVDWRQEYHTISEHARRVSQASFIDLYAKGQVTRRLQPMLWDPVDQTAIAQAEVEDKEMAGVFCDIYFEVTNEDGTALSEAEFGERKLNSDSDKNAIIWRQGRSYIVIGTTRPEMIPACVGIFFNEEDARYKGLKGKYAITPLFGVRVEIREDDTVEPDKGTGIMMCCTFGDEADIVKWRKYGLEKKIILNKGGRINLTDFLFNNAIDPELASAIDSLKVAAARENIIKLLRESGDLVEVKPITHAVKCAERSGAPLEILPTQQWFVNVLEHKAALREKSAACDWKPEWMAKRMEQWIDGLNWDWCISRQRYYGVPFPVWYAEEVEDIGGEDKNEPPTYMYVGGDKDVLILPLEKHLPVNPLDTEKTREILSELGYEYVEERGTGIDNQGNKDNITHLVKKNGTFFSIAPDTDVMDTWATSSLSPQISAWGSSGATNSVMPAQAGIQTNEALDSCLRRNDDTASFPLPTNRSDKLFPADLRPQAHEIIRTWAFYTLAKAHLHHDSIPWKTLMISGWCLAADKTKMSKSKGNTVTPTALLEAQSADAVRYWASTSRLGADTAFSEDLLKIGRKLVNKLWNASKFVATIIEGGVIPAQAGLVRAAKQIQTNITLDSRLRGNDENKTIIHTLDRWMLSRIHHAITVSDRAFAEYDYASARAAVEDVFWNDFCDNYLELVKSRAYGNMGEAAQASAHATLTAALNALLKLFAPFVPHITEEIYQLLYAEEAAHTGSIHARGNFPHAADYPEDAAAEAAGVTAVALLELVRKAKSERGVSIKAPIEAAWVSGVDAATLAAISDDFAAASSIALLHGEEAIAPAHAAHFTDEARKLTLRLVFAEIPVALPA